MKRASLSLLVAAVLLGGSVGARDIKTISGDVFKNIEVRSKDATGIQVMHDDGVIFLDFKNLSEADQKEFGYNPATYADGWKQKFEAERKRRREQAELVAQQAIARAKALAAQGQGNAPAPETWQPTNQTGLQVTVDSPGFIFGGYPVGGFIVPGTVIQTAPARNVLPYPYGYNGATWGPLEIRRR